MSINVDLIAKPLKVSRRIEETSDAISLVLEIPETLKSQFKYQAGQFVTFFMEVGGEKINRSYSLSSSPAVDSDFKVTIKRVTGGKGSNFLCDKVQAGSTLMTAPPAGGFFKPKSSAHGTHYFLFAAGSGVTPIYSIMKTVLKASAQNRVTFVYCNRNEESIIYKNELQTWAKENPGRLDIVHTLTQPSSSWQGRRGRINRTLLSEVLEMADANMGEREFYSCGPTEFMGFIRQSLTENGIATDRVHEENFGTAVHKPKTEINAGWTLIGPQVELGDESPEKIIAQINGETIEVNAKPGMSILETLIESGAQPPYSCMDGACMACLCKVQEGRVYQEDAGILSEDNVNLNEALTCQAKPLSRIVKVNYDNL